MLNQSTHNFGNLTLKQKKLYDIRKILNNNNAELDVLFQSTLSKLDNPTVIEAERQEALKNLRTLVSILQANRLKSKIRSEYKYFTFN